MELSEHVEPVDPDRNTLPGVARIGLDISEPVGGGPLRTLRLYGRSDVGADARGLRQVLLYDATHFVEELRTHQRPRLDVLLARVSLPGSGGNRASNRCSASCVERGRRGAA